MGTDTDLKNYVEALFLEPLAALAEMIEANDLPGDRAGALLSILVAGVRAKLADL